MPEAPWTPMEGFPYAPRPGQEALVAKIEAAQRGQGHLVAEAGTGSGKTVCALHASYRSQAQDGRRIIYATRTNSQQTQVVKEHQALAPDRLLIPFMGRKHYCPLLKDDERFQGGTSEELGRLCKDAKRKAQQALSTGEPVKGACPYYKRLLADGTGPVEAIVRAGGPVGDQVAAAGSCPYEALKLLMPEAHAIVVPYVFLLDDRLREALCQWTGSVPDQWHVIIDEAHNLPEATRQHHSPHLGLATVERALKEAERLQDPVLAGAMLSSGFLTTFHRIIRELADEHAGTSEDGLMPPGALEESLMLALRVPGPVIDRIARELEDWGEVVREQRREAGKLPRSHLGTVGAFLRLWREACDGPFVQLVTQEPRPALEAYLLDPSSRLRWLQEMASSTQLSGTLAPVATHARLCGLPDAAGLELPSPFDPDRLRVHGILGLRRGHQALQEDPELVARQQAAARRLLGQWSGRIGLWFPSHQMLQDYLEEGFLHGLDATVHVERPGMSTPELMALVRAFAADAAPRVLLLGVLGGRLTEGIDYPGDLMERMLIFGIPYPRPTARSQALIHHYDAKEGAGWRIAVHEPVGRTLRQAVGRLIRGPEDTGTAVVLDERIMRFRDRFPRLGMVDGPDAVEAGLVMARDDFAPASEWP